MKFDKTSFISKRGQAVYLMLMRFFDYEMIGSAHQYLKFLLELENIRSFVYEGNMYVIEKTTNNQVVIFDEIAEENGVPREQTTFTLNIQEFLEIMEQLYKQ